MPTFSTWLAHRGPIQMPDLCLWPPVSTRCRYPDAPPVQATTGWISHTPEPGRGVSNAAQPEARFCHDPERRRTWYGPGSHSTEGAIVRAPHPIRPSEVPTLRVPILWCLALPPGLQFPPASLSTLWQGGAPGWLLPSSISQVGQNWAGPHPRSKEEVPTQTHTQTWSGWQLPEPAGHVPNQRCGSEKVRRRLDQWSVGPIAVGHCVGHHNHLRGSLAIPWQATFRTDLPICHQRLWWPRAANWAAALLRLLPRRHVQRELLHHKGEAQRAWSRLARNPWLGRSSSSGHLQRGTFPDSTKRPNRRRSQSIRPRVPGLSTSLKDATTPITSSLASASKTVVSSAHRLRWSHRWHFLSGRGRRLFQMARSGRRQPTNRIRHSGLSPTNLQSTWPSRGLGVRQWYPVYVFHLRRLLPPTLHRTPPLTALPSPIQWSSGAICRHIQEGALKSRGEGTVDECLQAFLLSYRSTPNPATPGGQSPSEALMGRKLRTINEALIPTEKPPSHSGAYIKHKEFVVGAPVYARDYRAGRPRWIKATVTARRGDMLHDVSVGDDTWVRHRNQLRPRHGETSTPASHPVHLPLHILLDTFGMAPQRETTVEAAQSTPRLENPPCRRTERIRRSPKSLQVNPCQKRYAFSSKGGVAGTSNIPAKTRQKPQQNGCGKRGPIPPHNAAELSHSETRPQLHTF
ncbi:unnamed protein product [Dicrocoelium dendriticum]|nr:unnamed protein product [Dicrocoelium dendriticum]